MNLLNNVQFDMIHYFMDMEAISHELRVAVILAELVSFIPKKIKANYGLSDGELRCAFYKGGRYHDVGKVALRYPLFKAADELTCTTMLEILKQHTVYGRGYLLEYADELFCCDTEKQICTDIAVYHHERYDGTGYPFGLSADIPFAAQLCALANNFDNYCMENSSNSGEKLTAEKAHKSTVSDKGMACQNALDCFMAAKNLIISKHCSPQSPFGGKDMINCENKISKDSPIHIGDNLRRFVK